MKMIDLNTYEIKEVEEFKTVEVHLSLNHEMNLNIADFDLSLEAQLEGQLKEVGFSDLDGAVFFLIKTDLIKDDRNLMRDFLINRFVARTVLSQVPADRERRLAVPEGLDKANINRGALLDLVNKHDKIKQLNIGLATRSGKDISYVVEL